jgi:membrane protease YdiL (CAAX protease family)
MSSRDPFSPPSPADGLVQGPHARGDERITSAAERLPAAAGPPARLRKPHPGFWWALLECLGFLLVTQVPGALVGLGLMLVVYLARPDLARGINKIGEFYDSWLGQLSLAVAFVITELLVVGVSWLVIRLVVGRDWPRVLGLRRPGGFHVLLVLVGFPAFVLLGNGAFVLLRHVLHVPSFSDLGVPGMEEMVQVFNSWPAAFAVLVVGLGPGVGEELWCRGFLGRGLVGRYGWFAGMLATSFFFGLIHVDPCQGAMAMIMGMWLHFVYLTTRSLWLPMLVHFLNNSLSVLSSRLPVLQQIEEGREIPLVVYGAAAFLLAAIGYALYQSRSRLAAAEGGEPALWQPPYPGVEYPPPNSGTRVVHPRPSAAALAAVAAGVLVFVGVCVLVFAGS